LQNINVTQNYDPQLRSNLYQLLLNPHLELSVDEKAAHGEEAFQMLSWLQEMLCKLYLGFQKGDNDVDIKEMADRVAKLEQAVRVGATKKVGLSLILLGIDKGLDAPIEGLDNIHKRNDMLERLQWLTEEQGFFRVQDGGFKGIGGGDFDSTRVWVRENMRENMLDDSFGAFVDGRLVFNITPSRYMNSEEYAASVRHKGVAGMKNTEGSILTSIQNELPFMLAGDGSDRLMTW